MTPEAPRDVRDTSMRAKFHAILDAALDFNADATTVIGREADETLLFVATVARGEEAAALLEFLERKEAEPDTPESAAEEAPDPADWAERFEALGRTDREGKP